MTCNNDTSDADIMLKNAHLCGVECRFGPLLEYLYDSGSIISE